MLANLMIAAVIAAFVLTPIAARRAARAKGTPIPRWRALLHGAFVAAVASMFFAVGGWWALPGAVLCALAVLGFALTLRR